MGQFELVYKARKKIMIP